MKQKHYFILKNTHPGAGEVAERLKTFAVLMEDPGPVLCIHGQVVLMPSSEHHGILHSHVCGRAHTHT